MNVFMVLGQDINKTHCLTALPCCVKDFLIPGHQNATCRVFFRPQGILRTDRNGYLLLEGFRLVLSIDGSLARTRKFSVTTSGTVTQNLNSWSLGGVSGDGDGWAEGTMSAGGSRKTATRGAGKEEFLVGDGRGSTTVGLREERDGATKIGSDRVLSWLWSEIAVWVAAEVASARTELTNTAANWHAKRNSSKEEITKLDAGATVRNRVGVPRRTLSIADATPTAVKRPGLR